MQKKSLKEKQTLTSSLSRRSFIRNSALTVGAFTIVPRFVLGKGFVAPSDKINLAVIGLGKQGNGLANSFISNTQAQIIAGSDVWDTKRNFFQTRIQEIYAEKRGVANYNGVKTFLDYKEMLEMSEIDGVIVATPDHWHAIQSIDTMNSGKDLFCEKPLTLTIAGGQAMVRAARKNQAITQTGSMQRAWDRFKKAQEIVSSGKLGEITKVLVNVGDPAIPYNLPEQPLPQGVDWNRWCGPAPMITYHESIAPSFVKTFPDWRKFKETGGGILADWGAHMFDIAQWCLDMDHSGPIRYLPPTEKGSTRGLRMFYENGIEMVHEDFDRGWAVRFIGSEGSLDVSRGFLETTPASILSDDPEVNPKELYSQRWNFYQDWLSAIKTRNPASCPIEIGHRSASICNIANIAYELGRELNWDPVKEGFINDAEANKMKSRKARKY